MKTGYKVFLNEGSPEDGDVLTSAITTMPDLTVKYSKVDWTKTNPVPAKNGYHLLLFRTLQDATAFMYNEAKWPYFGGREIWRVLYKGQVKLPPFSTYLATYTNLTEEIIQRYSTIFNWPLGTIMAKEVLLLEREV